MSIEWARSKRYSIAVVLLGCLLLGGLWLFVWQHVKSDRERTLKEASRESMNLAKALEEQVRSILSQADHDMGIVKLAFEKEGPTCSVIKTIVEQTIETPTRFQIGITDEQGMFVVSSDARALGLDYSDREWFVRPRAAAKDALYISKTVTSRASGKTVIPLSRRLDKPDGSFGGVIHVSLDTGYLESLFNKLDLGPGGLISLNGMDGYIRFRYFQGTWESGQDIRAGEIWKQAHSSPYGSRIARGVADGVERMFTYRVMTDYSLFILLAPPTSTVLATHESNKKDYLYGALGISCIVVALCYLVIDRNRKLKSERNLLKTIIDTIPDRIFVKDLQARFILNNISHIKGLGAELQSEVLGKTDYDFRPLDIANRYFAADRQVMDTDTPLVNYEDLAALPSGEIGTLLISKVPFHNVAGEVIGLIGISRDVTERVRREQEFRRDAQLATRVQNTLLTVPKPSDYLSIDTVYQPFGYVGGDLYFMDWRYEGSLLRGFLVDTIGHGLNTALHTASLHVLLREVNERDVPLTEAMCWLNKRASEYFDEATFAGALGFELDLQTRQLSWVCAGLPDVWVATKKTEGVVTNAGMFLGIQAYETFEKHTLAIDIGDSFYFTTDGLSSLFAHPSELPFQNYSEMVALLQNLSATERRRDDATAICIHVRALPQSEVCQAGWPRVLRFNGYGDYQRLKGEVAKILEEVTGKPHSLQEVAVHEALANAMECRDGVPRQHKARLRFNKVGGRLIVRVKTSRIGFAGNAILRRLRSQPDDMFSFGEDASMGRGIPMMLSMSHKMTYNSEGTEVLLAWRLKDKEMHNESEA